MEVTDLKSGKSSRADSGATLDRRISEVEKALNYSRDFLEHLSIKDDEIRHRIEEIAYSYERELDRLRTKKDPASPPNSR